MPPRLVAPGDAIQIAPDCPSLVRFAGCFGIVHHVDGRRILVAVAYPPPRAAAAQGPASAWVHVPHGEYEVLGPAPWPPDVTPTAHHTGALTRALRTSDKG